jgi:hypothetical protein
MTDFALGEVQKDQPTPWPRHAVADATPGGVARAICPAEPLVWVHIVAGAAIPFPGPLGDDPGLACPECAALVARARATAQDTEPKRPQTAWERHWEWLRRRE